MSEAAFPVLGAAFVVTVVLPASALLAKAALTAIESPEFLGGRSAGPLHGLTSRYLVLVLASVLPIGWFLSAGLHQAETGRSVVACLLDHDAAELCREPGFFVATLTLVLVLSSWRRLWPTPGVRLSRSPRATRLAARIDGIVRGDPTLRSLQRRHDVTEAPRFALGTVALVRPRVVIGAAFAEALDDVALASALAHEAAHVRSFDPLRYLVLEVALAMNPIGRWLLAPHAARWLGAREAHCDREAVLGGASPLSLAEAIVLAARPHARCAVALGAHDAPMLKFRIDLLTAYAERAPARCCRREPSALVTAIALFAIAVLLPHGTGTGLLDALHSGTEHTLTYFSR